MVKRLLPIPEFAEIFMLINFSLSSRLFLLFTLSTKAVVLFLISQFHCFHSIISPLLHGTLSLSGGTHSDILVDQLSSVILLTCANHVSCLFFCFDALTQSVSSFLTLLMLIIHCFFLGSPFILTVMYMYFVYWIPDLPSYSITGWTILLYCVSLCSFISVFQAGKSLVPLVIFYLYLLFLWYHLSCYLVYLLTHKYLKFSTALIMLFTIGKCLV